MASPPLFPLAGALPVTEASAVVLGVSILLVAMWLYYFFR